jgi:hypothetical protein
MSTVHGIVVTGAEEGSELAAYPDRRKPPTGFVAEPTPRVTIRSGTSGGTTIDLDTWIAFRDAVDQMLGGAR